MILFKPFKSTYLFLFLFLNFQLISCAQKPPENNKNDPKKSVIIKTGAERTRLYLNLLRGKNVAIVANQTSIIEKTKKKDKNSIFYFIKDSNKALNNIFINSISTYNMVIICFIFD